MKNIETMNIDDNNDDVNINSNDDIITLIDGKRLTGIKLHLPVSSLNPVIAYYGVRYASLGVSYKSNDYLSKTTTTTTTVFTNYSNNIEMPALHRFSHSVASFFYESPIGIYSHTTLPPVCPQQLININLEDKNIPKQVKDRFIRLLPFLRNQDEDCLTLNIYVPQEDNKRQFYKRPIFLFVHGESYEYGSGNAYDLSVLSSYSNTIGITLNYRLGLLGFFSINNHGVSGNYALYDLHAAIMWIKTNIESFNGNPEEITLIGYGHGASLIHLFSLSKMSQGTTGNGIKRIILLNGSGFAPWSTSHQTTSIITELLKHLNISEQNLKNNVSFDSADRNTEYSNRKKSLFAQTPSLNFIKPTNDSGHISNSFAKNINVTTTTSSIPEQLLKQLFSVLKNSTTKFLIHLQEKLTQSFITTRLGPVMSKHLFPSYLFMNSSIEKTEHKHRLRKQQRQQQQKHWYKPKYPHFPGEFIKLNDQILKAPDIETSLFMKTDLLIGWTDAPASNLYYLQNDIHRMSYSDVLQQLVHEIYPYNQDAIKEIIEHAYCYSNELSLDSKKNNDDTIDNPGENIKENNCHWKIQDILSDGLYIVPIVQTLKMHSEHHTGQSNIQSSSSSLSSSLFTVGVHTKASSKKQFNNHNNDNVKSRKSTYALFFNYKTFQTLQKSKNTTTKQHLSMEKCGFGEDLPYLLGAPFISPNQLAPFSNEYSEIDKIISINLMNYLTNFMHNGDPNKEFIEKQTKMTPINWPEYTSDAKFYLQIVHQYYYLNTGDDSKDTQRLYQTKHIRNMWGTKEKEKHLFTIKQFYETDKHELWSTLFPRLTYLHRTNKLSRHNEDKENAEKHPDKQTLFNKYFYFLQLKEADWLHGQVNLEAKPTSRLLQNNGQTLENLLNLVENGRIYERHIVIPNISFSGNFSQLPLYKKNETDHISNTLVSFEKNELLMNFNSSNESHPNDDEIDTEFYYYSQALTTPGYSSLSSPSSSSSYSHPTLIWIVLAGSVLFLLNTLIFIAIYHQTHQLRNTTTYQQSKSSVNSSSFIQGTEETSTFKKNPVSNFFSLSKNEFRQMQNKDGKIITHADVSNTLSHVKISSSTPTSSTSNYYGLSDLSYSLQKPQFGLNTCRNQITPSFNEIPIVTLNPYNTTDNIHNVDNSNNVMNLWSIDSPTFIEHTTNPSHGTKYLAPFHCHQQRNLNIQSSIY
ncbi:Neuroligin-2 [Schistosoma japonicum]|nr:Neuroligin-2 [Schistosoma japonicum]